MSAGFPSRHDPGWAAQRVLDILGGSVAQRWTGRALARTFYQAGLRDIVAEPVPITLPPGVHHRLVGPALAAAAEGGRLRLRPTGTGWRPRRTPNGPGITATPSSG